MPGVYREKECPVCKKKFRGRGNCCSKSCSGKNRRWTEEEKQNIANGMREFYKTPEGVAAASINNRRVNAFKRNETPPVMAEEFAVDIPDVHSLSDYDEYLEGFEKGEDW